MAAALKDCAHCKEKFFPNKYHPGDQDYCTKPACRRASACASRKKWRTAQQETNPDFTAQESARKRGLRERQKRQAAALGALAPTAVILRVQHDLAWLRRTVVGLVRIIAGHPSQDAPNPGDMGGLCTALT
ncbi:MAG: hypothetical protein A3K18_25745 [Lentisphaerae bacterium RIFOXYA12_64_32]|nr:MAG: hypothetical protein A3K18_25745 [Lentisphaerae bacterium RIFOXYA12_64_32]